MYYKLLADGTIKGMNDIKEWGVFMENVELRRIDRTKISNDIRVSTVFLGLDHGFGEGEPILFETMVFGGKYDEYQKRYCTEKEAKAGHDKTVKMVRKAIK